MERVDVEIVRRSDLDDLPEVHHRDSFGDAANDREIVRDEQIRQPELLSGLLHQVDDLRLDRDVQRRYRLVADEKLRLHRECSRDTDALPLATGELMRVPPTRPGRQADTREELATASCPPLYRLAEVDAQRFADHSADRMRGLSEPNGSWKIICIRRRSDRSSLFLRVACVLPVEHRRPRSARTAEESRDRESTFRTRTRRRARASLPDRS